MLRRRRFLRLFRDKRGQARIIEAFLASVLLLSCLLLIPKPATPQNQTANLTSTAQNVLLSLDNNGQLAALIGCQNWTAIEESLQSALPLTFWFNLTVFDQFMNTLNPFPICNGGAMSNTITSVDYVCVSQNSTYHLFILRLQLSEAGVS